MSNKFSIKDKWITWLLILALGLALTACSSPEERAQAHYQSGEELLKAGEFAKAGLEFRNALKYNEKHAEAWLGLAAVGEHDQNWGLVTESLQRGVELDPKNVDALLKLAKLQLAAIQLDAALKNVNAANDLKRDDTDVLALRAAILFRLGDREGARRDAEAALARNPDNPDALAVLGADQIMDQNMPAALRFIDRGLQKNANNLGLLMFKLKIFADSKDEKNLEAVLRQIIAAYPALTEIRQALLGLMASQNRLADVEAEMRAIAAANPADTAKALDLVSFLGRSKGAEAAQAELAAHIAANPDTAVYKLALAQLHFSQKKTDDATAAVEGIIAKGEPKADVQRAQLLLASMKIQLNQVDAGKALIEEVLAADAKNADALSLRAELSLRAGDADGAVADLREALSEEPNSVPRLVLLARAHERAGAVELAGDRLAQALKAANYQPQVALDYIAFLERRGRRDDVEATLNDAVARHPADRRLLTALAKLRLNKQDWLGAQRVAEALNKLGDTSGVSSQIAGAVLLGQNKVDESIETLRSAYAAQPQGPQALYSLVFAYLKADKASDAEAFLQSALAANEKNVDALVLLGAVRDTQNKPAEAEAAYKLAIERQPASPTGYVALSRHYFAQKKPDEAEAVLKRGHESVPTDLNINLALASLRELKNDTEGAIAIYDAQLTSAPDALVVVNNLASLLADYRTDAASLERARLLAQRLAAVDVPQFKDTVGWVAYRSGDYRTALLNLEAAAEKLPDLALVKYHLAMTYAALKRNADARAEFAKAEALITVDDPLKAKIAAAVAALTAANSGG